METKIFKITRRDGYWYKVKGEKAKNDLLSSLGDCVASVECWNEVKL